MIEIVDIIVRGEKFTERYETQRIKIEPGDFCLVESQIGIQMGKIVSEPRVMKARCVEEKLPKIIRKASDTDLEILEQLEQIEAEARTFCIDRIDELKLDMKLVQVLFAFDKSKGLFMFTADGRVDFRELVRDLAHHFKTRIEMKQIGIRDEARLLGGIGNCGCPLCCVTFLREFHPVSIKMAKDQGLSLIPSKISGLCGRLMCCLQYEHHHYSEQVKALPKMGKRVVTPKGEGRVRQLNILRGLVMVDLIDGEMEEFESADVIPFHIYQKMQQEKEKEEQERAAEDNASDKTGENIEPKVSDTREVSSQSKDASVGKPSENPDCSDEQTGKDKFQSQKRRPRRSNRRRPPMKQVNERKSTDNESKPDRSETPGTAGKDQPGSDRPRRRKRSQRPNRNRNEKRTTDQG